jgi:FKBP-type peptidyl-prolyl cis-trans isomerase
MNMNNPYTTAAYKTLIQEGYGVAPPLGSTVTVHYTGRFENSSVFDSSVQRGTPFEFVLGQGQVIKGWDLGVATMKQGEKAILICPPHLGYGQRQVGPIPPNSTLYFEVELLGWK